MSDRLQKPQGPQGLCQFRENGEVCIRMNGHDGDHLMADDTAAQIAESVAKVNGDNTEFAKRLSDSLTRNKPILDRLAEND